MIRKKFRQIDMDNIDKASSDFLETSKSNPFYNKNVFITQGLGESKYIIFQILGNLGGLAIDYEFTTEIDYIIVTDSLINDLREGKKIEQLRLIETKINDKGKNYENLKIISESAFLSYVKIRSETINDNVTLNLLNKVS